MDKPIRQSALHFIGHSLGTPSPLRTIAKSGLTDDMHLSPVLLYVLIVIAVEVFILFLLFIFSSEDEWAMEQSKIERESECYECVSFCTLSKETMVLFVSTSTTQNWSNEYAIIVLLQRNRAFTTRIIDMSYLQYDIKAMIRKYEKDFLHMSLSACGQTAVVMNDCEVLQEGDEVASVIIKLLQNNVKTDLHKIPMNGVRILYLTMQV